MTLADANEFSNGKQNRPVAIKSLGPVSDKYVNERSLAFPITRGASALKNRTKCLGRRTVPKMAARQMFSQHSLTPFGIRFFLWSLLIPISAFLIDMSLEKCSVLPSKIQIFLVASKLYWMDVSISNV